MVGGTNQVPTGAPRGRHDFGGVGLRARLDAQRTPGTWVPLPAGGPGGAACFELVEGGDSQDVQARALLLACDIDPHELGAQGERVACTHLEQLGYEVVERNWICPEGEVDIIARDGRQCVLVEVKTRQAARSHDDVRPELAVDARKRRRYTRVAACYMAAHDAPLVRFDVVAVTVVGGRIALVHHIVNAFGGEA